MGVIFWDDIPEWYDPGLSHDIAAYESRTAVTLTRIGPRSAHDGELIYVDEVPATADWFPRDVEYQLGTAERSRPAVMTCIRLEVQVPRTETRIQPGMHLTLARKRTACWVTFLPFKPPNKKGKSAATSPVAEPVASEEQIVERLVNYPVDFWETRNFLTAGLLRLADRYLPDAGRFSSGPWALGVCDDFNGCCTVLSNHPHVRKLLDQTVAGNLMFGPKEAPAHLRKLRDEVRDDGGGLMNSAICQALAGPEKDCDYWIGRPVVELVDDVFRDLVFYRNRKMIEDDLQNGT